MGGAATPSAETMVALPNPVVPGSIVAGLPLADALLVGVCTSNGSGRSTRQWRLTSLLWLAVTMECSMLHRCAAYWFSYLKVVF